MQRRRFDTDEAPFDTEDEAPKYERRSRRAAADEEEAVAPDGEETVVPFFTGRKRIKENRPATDGGLYFRWPDDGEKAVVKFLPVEPWAYNQHWVTREGRKSFPCLGEGCPLCKVGSKVSQKIVYTLANFSTGDEPLVQILEVTPTLDETIMGYDEDKKTGPIDRLFWALSRTKGARSASFTKYNYSFLPIKERDLEEDWGISLDKADRFIDDAEVPEPEKVLGKVNRSDLQEIADEVMSQS